MPLKYSLKLLKHVGFDTEITGMTLLDLMCLCGPQNIHQYGYGDCLIISLMNWFSKLLMNLTDVYVV